MQHTSLLNVVRARGAQRSLRLLRMVFVATVAALISAVLPASAVRGHTPADTLHGGTGKGVKVLGHTDLGGGGLNGHVSVLGNHAYVGYGTNGGYLGIWNKTPKCADTANPVPTGTVKVVSLSDPANPTVVEEIDVTAFRVNLEPHLTLARDVATLRVQTAQGTYDLLAVALEGCAATLGGDVGPTGVNFYDVTSPTNPIFLSHDAREVPGVFGTRQVSLAQTATGRVLAFEANIGGDPAGAIDVVDVTNPTTPVQLGRYDENNNDAGTGSCRPFNPAAGVSVNAAGTRAYGAYYDQGVIEFDVNEGAITERRETPYVGHPATEEGNSFRFEPNAAETLAVATDEDLNPAKTTLTVNTATGPQSFAACEAIWGGPLYRQATPSLTGDIVYTANSGCTAAEYTGKNVAGKMAMVDRQGCGFHVKAQVAQAQGATAVVVGLNGVTNIFSPDSAVPGDAGVTIPVVMTTLAAKQAVIAAPADPVTGNPTGSLVDTAESWGALRVFDIASTGPTAPQLSVFHSPHSNVLTPDDGLYHAVNATWRGDHALVAWMSDGLRSVDLTNPAAPTSTAFYVPPAAADPTGNYPAVPLVVDAEKYGNKVVITDVNGGLYVLAMATNKDACKNGGWQSLGFVDQAECVASFDI